jgi:NTP pyrophosphatase (non-canonical NTP hydrolase)
MGKTTQTGSGVTYGEFVDGFVKEGEEIRAALTPDECHLWHMATGVAGEAGELLDAIKKHVVYRRSLDMQNVVEELGDIEFFLQGLRSHLGVTREEVVAQNIEKLSKRYHLGVYSDAQAQNRADKA